MGGIYVALTLYALPDRLLAISGKALFILAVLSVVMAFSNASASLIRASAGRITGPLPMASLTHHAIRIVLWILGALIVLNTLGISVTPILATLGVGGLAVALALQDTLANLFAGFHIIASRQVRSGDFVRLEGGQEGTIEDIGWRITKIRMLSNNIVLIPNAKLAQAVLINYHLPDPEMSVLIDVSVHYDSDLTLVEKVTVDVATELLRSVAGGVSGFTPFIRYHTFGDSGIHFTVILRVKGFTDQYLIKHEFVKRLHERYRSEGIVIPYPMRTLTWEPAGGPPAQPAGPVS
ncbi:mechanosensitive ion channel family protein [bacterium]|nr:mechanosensitive ion channel family protein [bacterium]